MRSWVWRRALFFTAGPASVAKLPTSQWWYLELVQTCAEAIGGGSGAKQLLGTQSPRHAKAAPLVVAVMQFNIGYRLTTIIGMVMATVGFLFIWQTWELEISNFNIV